MFNDHAGRLGKLFYTLERGIGVGNIVIRQRLALKLLGSANARLGGFAFNIERRCLMRVLAVAHVLCLKELAIKCAGKRRRLAL